MLSAVCTDGSAVAWTESRRRRVDFLQGRSRSWQSQLIPDHAINGRLHVLHMELHTLFPSHAPGTAWYFLGSSRVPEYGDGPYRVRSWLTAADVICSSGWTLGDEQGPPPPAGSISQTLSHPTSPAINTGSTRGSQMLWSWNPKASTGVLPGWTRRKEEMPEAGPALSLSWWKRNSGHVCLEQMLGVDPSSLSSLTRCSYITFFQGYIKTGKEIERLLISHWNCGWLRWPEAQALL